MRALLIAASAMAVIGLAGAGSAIADPFFFSTGDPDGRIATASRPGSGGAFEIESADDFVLSAPTTLSSATFTGLLTGASPSVNGVVVEIYRVFPQDSDVGRTSGAPTFSTSRVPTRVNSPSDAAFTSRDSAAASELAFTTSLLSASFSATNSVRPGGIHSLPGQTTGGDAAVTGEEVVFDVSLTAPLALPAGHYFFVPQVATSGGDFLWLSAPKPITTGTPFVPDLQSWTRDEFLAPDWLRIGTDIVDGSPAPTFNATFSLTGETVVPEPASLILLASALAGLGLLRRVTAGRWGGLRSD